MPTAAFRLACTLLAATLPALAPAQTPPVKPGLWEVVSEQGADGQKAAPTAERMKNLPPEARARLEAMMKDKGIAMGPGGVNRLCFTRESMDPARWANSTNCKTDYGARSASSWKWHSVCTAPAVVVDGEAVFASPESYTVNTSTTMTLRGETKTMQRSIRAKWLGAECGDLKPLDLKR
ncbi:MAG: DUF3617 domain-containing protein [Caldimonas sp.]